MTRIARWIVPRTFRSGGLLRSVWQINVHVLKDYGWLRSLRGGRSVSADGQAIPWFTYPAVDFLRQLDYSTKRVFEYGSGMSTLFWDKRAASVVAVETSEEWLTAVRDQASARCALILSTADADEYANQIQAYGDFDVIVIDGPGPTRPVCCRQAVRHLAPGGIVILDNSDLWPASAAILRDADLIQVDFTGLAPLTVHAHTTSVFFRRDYAFTARGSIQPHKSVAQPAEPWPGF
jgi:hypothetical protein